MQFIRLAKKFLRLVGTACMLALLTAAEGALAQQPPERPGNVGFRPGQTPDNFLSQLRNERFRERLKLTEEQTRTLDQQRMDMFNAMRMAASREGMPGILKEFDQKAVDLLTEEQKRIWEERKSELKSVTDAATATAAAKEAEVGKLLTELKALKKDRSDTLQQLAEAVEQRYRNEQTTLASATQASHRQFEAALELASTKAERFASHEKLIENLRRLEKDAESIHKAKAGPVDDVLEAKAARLKAEIDLLHEKIGGK